MLTMTLRRHRHEGVRVLYPTHLQVEDLEIVKSPAHKERIQEYMDIIFEYWNFVC